MMNCTPKVGQKTFGVQFMREFSARCAEVGESGFAPTVWYSMIYICNGMINWARHAVPMHSMETALP